MLHVDPHPALDLGVLVIELPAPLGELEVPERLLALHDLGAEAPLAPSDEVRAAVRSLLRHGGYKPTGRGKPSSEYLLRAAGEGRLGSINLVVDACNAVSLHSGLPISVVDLERAEAPLRVALAAPESSHVFNPSGQEIRVGGLLCLHDALGPCANAVKDAQRTKTDARTRRALTLIWGTQEFPDRTAAALRWCAELLKREGAVCRPDSC